MRGSTYVYSQSKLDLVTEIKEIFNADKRRYGSRRIQGFLVDKGNIIFPKHLKADLQSLDDIQNFCE